MLADSFRWSEDSDGQWLSIRTSGARKICESIEPCKQYDVEVKEHREKRSLDANAYCWVLIGKLSSKLHIAPAEVYRQYIQDIGGNYTIVPVKESKIKHWERIWCSGHIGRMVKDMGPCRGLDGYHNIMSYIGSSDYDTAQMSRLIDLIVQDCKAQGIETLTPDKLDAMKVKWGEAYGDR